MLQYYLSRTGWLNKILRIIGQYRAVGMGKVFLTERTFSEIYGRVCEGTAKTVNFWIDNWQISDTAVLIKNND